MCRCFLHYDVGPCEDLFALTIFQDALYAAKLIRFMGSLSETVVGCCRCLKKVFTAVSVLYGQTYVISRIPSTCRTSLKSPVSKYNQVSSSNGQAPAVWWYLFNFSAIISFSGGIVSVVSSVLMSVCCLVQKVVPGFLNQPSMYLIYLARVRSSSIICVLCISVADGPLPDSNKALARLVWY